MIEDIKNMHKMSADQKEKARQEIEAELAMDEWDEAVAELEAADAAAFEEEAQAVIHSGF